jgi:hypothetical protein
VAERPLLNHAEMVYRPGDREAARAFFETMGFEISERTGFPWLAVVVDPKAGRSGDNVMYVNESTPAQQNFEQALDQALASDSKLAYKLERYLSIRRAHPQYVFHFGASVPTHGDWQERVDRLREANRDHPLLTGRIDVDVREPGDPGALGPLSQAFVHTDVIAAGPFQTDRLLFDLQWAPEIDYQNMPPIDFPDRTAMV